MAGNSNFGGRYSPRTDTFGNEYMVVGVKIRNNKSGEKGFGRGFVEIGGNLFKVEVTEGRKEGIQAWVKLTKMKPQRQGGRW